MAAQEYYHGTLPHRQHVNGYPQPYQTPYPQGPIPQYMNQPPQHTPYNPTPYASAPQSPYDKPNQPPFPGPPPPPYSPYSPPLPPQKQSAYTPQHNLQSQFPGYTQPYPPRQQSTSSYLRPLADAPYRTQSESRIARLRDDDRESRHCHHDHYDHHDRHDDRSRSRSRSRRRSHDGHDRRRRSHTGRDTFLGATGGAIIGDAIFPGLGTAAGAILGGWGGNKHAKQKSGRELDPRKP